MTAFGDRRKVTVREAAILTGSYVAGTVFEMRDDTSQLNLYVDFTIGSLTSAEIKVEYSEDNSDYYQDTVKSISGGTTTLTVNEFQLTATGKYRISIPIKDRYTKVSIKGTGTASGSSAAIKAIFGLL